jgi:predicted AlkP superfamily pyrophosphatase or phosphodiesterase
LEGYEYRVAIVTYSDFYDGPNHIEFRDFTTDVDSIVSFIDKLELKHGGDAAEDVIGGLEKGL